MAHLEPSWILPVGLVWFGLYICPINQTCTYDWAKEKILIHYIGELTYVKRTSPA
ncbi:hypothetical protein [Bacteroides acidifaciens]|uniref:hypothetical protein n=1 Tax=Bacteroides acidifaciens TaxID=85831 RepID=UPI002578B182|nr:hypothetical protein [Bacteroides acidifaciens]